MAPLSTGADFGARVFFALAASAPLAVVAAFLFVFLYRRATDRLMRSHAGAPRQGVQPEQPRPFTTASLAGLISPDGANSRLHFPRLALVAYSVAGAAYSLGLSIVVATVVGPSILRLAVLLVLFFWPAVLAIIVAVSPGRRESLTLLASYAAAVVVVNAVAAAASGSAGELGALLLAWLVLSGLGTLFVLAILMRRIRAAGPFILVATTVATVAFALLADALTAIVLSDNQAGLSLDAVIFLSIAGIALLGIAVVWSVRGVAKLYRVRLVNDQSLRADAVFLLFGAWASAILAPGGSAYLLAGPVAFLAYKATAILLLSRLKRVEGSPPTLLVLRVFTLGTRSEAFYRRISAHWLSEGPITMIAGPDLVAATLQPDEMMAFASGRHAEGFVRDDQDLAARLAAISRTPDWDGRFRLTELFCFADTWQDAMVELARGSDAVILDLRGFSAANKGCEFELKQLVALDDLKRAVLLTDPSTDRGFLQEVLAGLSSHARHEPRVEPSLLAIWEPEREVSTNIVLEYLLRDADETARP